MHKIKCIFTLGLTALILTACGEDESTKPVGVVTSFLENIQAGDLDKAGTYVAVENESGDINFSGMEEKNDDPLSAALLNGISNNYKFSKLKENTIDENNSEVNVEITSIDYAATINTAMENIFKTSFDFPKEVQTEEDYKEALREKSIEIINSEMTSKDAKMITRNVTLTLTKNDEGKYKIVPNEQLRETVFGNAAEVDEIRSRF